MVATSHWKECEFVVLDVEGNGAPQQEIIEIALVTLQQGRIVSTHDWMVRPKHAVTGHATQLHGITNQALIGKPEISTIAEQLLAQLDSRIVIGHHVAVDISMLRRELPEWSAPTYIDTLRLAKHLFPGLASYSLEAMDNFALRGCRAVRHRAREDALVTAELFLLMAAKLDAAVPLDLLTLARLASPPDAHILQDQQGSLF
jgi:exodeoxyribonuclease X